MLVKRLGRGLVSELADVPNALINGIIQPVAFISSRWGTGLSRHLTPE
jgi:hypothetical protein